MVKVSVIVPIFNVEKYLEQCLNSLVNQTLQDIEIICVNDGSTDSSANILDKFAKKDNRIKVINKENSGYGHSMNIGLANATGEYIGIVESDDFVENTMFADLYKLASENDLDIIKSDFYYYANKKARKAGKISKSKTNKIFNIKDDATILKIMPTIWSSIYKKSFLDENNIKFLETPGASYQDTSFAFKTLVCAKKIMFTDKAYLYYRQDNENSSVNSKEKVFAITDEWNEITRFLDSKPEIKTLLNDIKLAIQFNAYSWNLLRLAPEFRNEFIDCFSETFSKFYENNDIKKNFYKKELQMLLTNKSEYRFYIDKLAEKQEKTKNRRNKFSIRINSSRISIVLFGKSIVEVSF